MGPSETGLNFREVCYKRGSISPPHLGGGRDTELPKPSRTLLGVVDSPIEPTLLANYARQWIGNCCPFTPPYTY